MFSVNLRHSFGPDRNIDKSQVFAKIFYRSGAQEEFLCLRSDLGSSLTRSLGQVYSLHSDASMLCSDHYWYVHQAFLSVNISTSDSIIRASSEYKLPIRKIIEYSLLITSVQFQKNIQAHIITLDYKVKSSSSRSQSAYMKFSIQRPVDSRRAMLMTE